ncbi:carbohydrate kinase family protein [Conexibacter woesei]|uniref:carbohydrate kinase family protein n=1 Tax=Conexibacter woesei TaxID=191495 RepID=UPI0003FC96D9|nr:PfkB family carbohydrate kinase [Conexibacter woesei]
MLDVLVVGDLNPDLLLSGDVVPRFGQAEQDVTATVALGGSGGICAAALGRLGLRTALAAAVGDDDLGALVTQRLADRGVHLDQLQRAAQPTGLSVHLLRDDDRAILTHSGAIDDLDVASACRAIRAAKPRHVHVTSVFLIRALRERGADLLDAARDVAAVVSVDTNYDPAERFDAPAWLLDADVLLPNAAEARGLARSVDVEQAARELSARGATVVVKLGAQGALAVTSGETLRVAAPAPTVPIVDTVGAGDAFDAGFIRARLDGHDLPTQLAHATAAGTLSTRAGGDAGQPTLEDVLGVAR